MTKADNNNLQFSISMSYEMYRAIGDEAKLQGKAWAQFWRETIQKELDAQAAQRSAKEDKKADK